MKEYKLIFNQNLYDTVSRALTEYEEENDEISAKNMYQVLVTIQNEMASSEET